MTLPLNTWVRRGEVVLSTGLAPAIGTSVRTGDQLVLQGRSVLVLRQELMEQIKKGGVPRS